MADDYSVGEAPAKARGIMSKRVFGVPIIYLAVIPVIALAFYAWRTKDTSAEAAADATDPDPTGEGEGLDTSGLYPISPTGTVYAQSPTQTVEDLSLIHI